MRAENDQSTPLVQERRDRLEADPRVVETAAVPKVATVNKRTPPGEKKAIDVPALAQPVVTWEAAPEIGERVPDGGGIEQRMPRANQVEQPVGATQSRKADGGGEHPQSQRAAAVIDDVVAFFHSEIGPFFCVQEHSRSSYADSPEVATGKRCWRNRANSATDAS